MSISRKMLDMIPGSHDQLMFSKSNLSLVFVVSAGQWMNFYLGRRILLFAMHLVLYSLHGNTSSRLQSSLEVSGHFVVCRHSSSALKTNQLEGTQGIKSLVLPSQQLFKAEIVLILYVAVNLRHSCLSFFIYIFLYIYFLISVYLFLSILNYTFSARNNGYELLVSNSDNL